MSPAAGAAGVPGTRAPWWADALLLAALGALQTLAFVHTTTLWPLPLLATAVLVQRLAAAPSVAGAAWRAWLFGLAWLCAGTWWLFISMHRYGHLPALLAGAAVVALAGFLSLYLAAAGAAFRRWRRGGGADVPLWAALWLLAELARGVVFTGFPWVASGYAQVDGPLAALAPWVGVYGIGAVQAALAAVLAWAWAAATRPAGGGEARRTLAAGLLAAVSVALLLPAWRGPGQFTQAGRTLTVKLLQPNVAQDEKFAVERMPATLAWVQQRLLSSTADLVVAPETAVPLLPGQLEDFAPGYWATLRQRFARGPQAALVGVPLGDEATGYTNSVAGLSAGAAALPGGQYRYDKHHLVPFGEFIPTGFRWFTEALRIPLGDFNRGGLVQPTFDVLGERTAPHICYEDLFGEELARRFADPARAPTVLVNLSNIGWFGDSVAVPQHLAISRLRALEFQRPMLRATNTGATAVVDHLGRVQAQLPPFTEGVLQDQVQGRHGQTPFATWASRFGLWPLLLLALAACAAVVLSGRRAAAAPGGPR